MQNCMRQISSHIKRPMAAELAVSHAAGLKKRVSWTTNLNASRCGVLIVAAKRELLEILASNKIYSTND